MIFTNVKEQPVTLLNGDTGNSSEGAMEDLMAAAHQCHERHVPAPTGAEVLLAFVCPDKVLQWQVVLDNQDEESLDWPLHPEAFLQGLSDVLRVVEQEPVRHFQLHFRMQNFALMSLVGEPQGYVHSLVTATVIDHMLMTPFAASDEVESTFEALCRRVWGKYWSRAQCLHTNSEPHEHDD